ncbi:unnamed protein product [Anisakis simplex]|uniref:procollagen-proline 4-dioxygenase n=1 Tax=Anisakis simplex TaxID=6269 RepID=A0A0M3K3H0_ANISI|nr:unnamed protein product [Anisakis simplex]
MLITLLLVVFSTVCSADIFTAIADMQNLLGAEKEVTTIISAYIDSEFERLKQLKDMASEYTRRNTEAVSSGSSYVTNPVNAYLLIKRLTSDWQYLEDMMTQNSAEQFIKNITEKRKTFGEVRYPQREDLTGAAIALLRLQDTYKLDTHDIASGNIRGKYIGQQLTSHDCFEVGRSAYQQFDYYHTILWMQEALLRVENEDPQTARTSAQKYNVKWYEDMLDEKDRITSELPPLRLERFDDGTPERDSYESLCRGEVQVNETEQSIVYCYLKMDRPFLKLAPIKIEILRFEPLVVLYRGIISDYEISVVEQLAVPKLNRATVQNSKTGDLEYAPYRISKSAWLKGNEHPVIERLSRRFDLMTNLNQDTAEDLQAQNYGIGGHYDPHFDFARRSAKDPRTVLQLHCYFLQVFGECIFSKLQKEETNAFKTLNTGNRIATLLIYMSDVESGGATIFNYLNTAIFPSKHDAIFWYNLLRNGEGDMRTRHAGCPVLTGNKWVSNKWMHERGQEFRRPCGLTPDAAERYIGDLTP